MAGLSDFRSVRARARARDVVRVAWRRVTDARAPLRMRGAAVPPHSRAVCCTSVRSSSCLPGLLDVTVRELRDGVDVQPTATGDAAGSRRRRDDRCPASAYYW